MEPGEPTNAGAFDYSQLAAPFRVLAKPAQRALINNGIYTVVDLAQWRRADLAKLHGIGPSAFPKLDAILAVEGRTFA